MTEESTALTSHSDPPEDFYVLESMVSEHDADGDAPLRRGEQPFSWLVAEGLARSVMAQYADIRVAVWLLRATMAQRGLEGLAEGLVAIAGLLTAQAPELLDEEAQQELVAQLSWLASGPFRLQAERLATGLAAPCDTLIGLARRGEGGGGSDAHDRAVSALQAARAALAQIVAFCGRLEVLPLPEFDVFESMLHQALQAAAKAEGVQAAEPEAAQPDAPRNGSLLTVDSREDAQRCLEALIKYFSVHEPGHPAPLFLARVQRMLGASFESLMNELYQEGPKLVQLINTPRQS